MTTPDEAVQRVSAAIFARDEAGYGTAMQDLVAAVQSAAPGDIEPALVRLAPLLAAVPLGPVPDLAQVAGSMAGLVADTSPVLGVLVERACEAMEQAAKFLAAHRQVLGDPPSAEDTSKIMETLERFVPAAQSAERWLG